MRLISPLLKHVVYPGLARAGYLKHTANTGPVVITYHGVIPPGYESSEWHLDGSLVRVDFFRRQLALLSRRYNIISPQQFRDWRRGKGELPDNAVLLTCDDGLQNAVHMLPILQENGMKCLFFITGYSLGNQPAMLWHEELYLLLWHAKKPCSVNSPIGEFRDIRDRNWRTTWWKLVESLSSFDEKTRKEFLADILTQSGVAPGWQHELLNSAKTRERFSVLDQSGLCQLVNAGHSLGAHSMSHPLLSRAQDDVAWVEIASSRELLEHATGQAVWAFAYPFGNPGSVSNRELRFAECAGFECAFLNTEERVKGSWYALPRVHVTNEMSLAEFEAHVSGFHSRLRHGIKQQLGA